MEDSCQQDANESERAIDFMPPGQEQVAIIVDVSWQPSRNVLGD